jgi:formylglycine-generating enzyme required for sulfatase activity
MDPHVSCQPGTDTSGADQWPDVAQVGSFAANAWGLHDVIGNALEWIQDCYKPGALVLMPVMPVFQRTAGHGCRNPAPVG